MMGKQKQKNDEKKGRLAPPRNKSYAAAQQRAVQRRPCFEPVLYVPIGRSYVRMVDPQKEKSHEKAFTFNSTVHHTSSDLIGD